MTLHVATNISSLNCCTLHSFINDIKTIERNPPGNPHLRNFDVAHDLRKASTTRNNLQPPASTTKKQHKEAPAVSLAILSKKCPRPQLNYPFQNPNTTSFKRT